MVRWFLSLCVFTLVLAVASAGADPGDPFCCETTLDGLQRLILIPDEGGTDPHPAASFTVTVRNNDCVPLPNAVVEVLIAGLGEGRTRLCPDAVTVAYTDENGVAEFNIAGGGCYKGVGAVGIRANGVLIREFDVVVSPDYAGWDNVGVAGRSSLSINPIDLAAFVSAYQGGTGPTSCHDYDNNGGVGPTDLALFVLAWSGGTRDCWP